MDYDSIPLFGGYTWQHSGVTSGSELRISPHSAWGDHMGRYELNLGWPRAKHDLYLLYYLSSPDSIHFKTLNT